MKFCNGYPVRYFLRGFLANVILSSVSLSLFWVATTEAANLLALNVVLVNVVAVLLLLLLLLLFSIGLESCNTAESTEYQILLHLHVVDTRFCCNCKGTN